MGSAGELIVLASMYECVVDAARTGGRDRVLNACKAFWSTYESLSLDSGVDWVTHLIAQYTNEVRSIENRFKRRWCLWQMTAGVVACLRIGRRVVTHAATHREVVSLTNVQPHSVCWNAAGVAAPVTRR